MSRAGATEARGVRTPDYDRTCAACHGVARQGTPPHTPPLVDLTRTPQEIETVILQGRNAMPAFRQFRPAEVSALAAFLKTPPTEDPRPVTAAAAHRYTIDGYPLFLDPHGVPAIAPPWGTLNAIDLVKGEVAWRVPLGEYPQLVAKGIRNTGTLNFGGAVATAGGVIFMPPPPTRRSAPSRRARAACCGSTSSRPAAMRRQAST